MDFLIFVVFMVFFVYVVWSGSRLSSKQEASQTNAIASFRTSRSATVEDQGFTWSKDGYGLRWTPVNRPHYPELRIGIKPGLPDTEFRARRRGRECHAVADVSVDQVTHWKEEQYNVYSRSPNFVRQLETAGVKTVLAPPEQFSYRIDKQGFIVVKKAILTENGNFHMARSAWGEEQFLGAEKTGLALARLLDSLPR